MKRAINKAVPACESGVRLYHRHRAASLTGYGLIVGLIAIAAIAAVSSVGDEVSALFGSVSEQMESASRAISGSASEEGEGDPLAACVAQGTGTECDDGSYYVGTLSGEPRFMTSSAHQSPTNLPWSPDQLGDGSQMIHGTDGKVNVAVMKTFGGSFADNFPAAYYCETLTAHGHMDWYLPAGGNGSTELNLLWEMVQTVGEEVSGIGNPSNHTHFWSSRERLSSDAWVQRFSTGLQDNSNKGINRPVRCVRR